jgi:hypothetical protein
MRSDPFGALTHLDFLLFAVIVTTGEQLENPEDRNNQEILNDRKSERPEKPERTKGPSWGQSANILTQTMLPAALGNAGGLNLLSQ